MADLNWLAEQRIQEAMRNGEFQDLAGHGKPLELEDLSRVPEELRMSYKLLKNAGVVPEELSLRAECVTLQELLMACHNEGEGDQQSKELKRKLSLKKLRLQQLLEQRGIHNSAVFTEYGDSIWGKIERE